MKTKTKVDNQQEYNFTSSLKNKSLPKEPKLSQGFPKTNVKTVFQGHVYKKLPPNVVKNIKKLLKTSHRFP